MPQDAQLLLIDQRVVEQLLLADDVLPAVREAFTLHSQGAGRVFPVVREKLATGGVFGIKSGDVGAQDLLGFKAAGFWPGNHARGGEAHQATVLLFDPHTGRPQCVIDGNAITTARTGAAGAWGIATFARADSATATVFGTGIQATVQLDFALRTLPALQRVAYVSRSGERSARFEAAFAGRCALQHATDADAAVAASDLVITATTGGGPLFAADAVRAGTHLNCVGADTPGKRELPPGLLARATAVFVDDLQQSRTLGELQWQPEIAATEIGAVLAGAAPFTRAPGDITVFDLTGLALQDLTVGHMLYQRARSRGLGTVVAWPW